MTLRRVAPGPVRWPLHDAAAARALEAAALAATPPHALMERAGLAVARLALALAPHARRIAVFAGPGNNGGDGFVAARHLQAAGKAVQLHFSGDATKLPADAAVAFARAAGVPQVVDDGWDLAIDALLGLGTRRAPEGAIAAAIERLNTAGAPVLAVDLPSGLHPDTGMPLGAACVQASATLSLLSLKPGLFTGRGRDLAGSVWWDDLGVAADGPTAELGATPAPSRRLHAQHKGSFGDVLVVGGAPGMGGAAQLAARAALAAGAGRVYLSPLDAAAPNLDAARPELMHRDRAWSQPAATLAAATVVCGCGGGTAVREALPALLAHAGRLVLDADALNAIAADPALHTLLAQRAPRGLRTVMTPHPLEAARLLATDTAAVQADRVAAARRLAERWRCTVVLKGSGSVIASPGRLPTLNPTGNALLATAGTGDVLAGWLGGRWAQGAEAHEAACAAACEHGHAADQAWAAGRRTPLLAADLIGFMSGA